MTSSLRPPAICPSYQSRKKDRKEFHGGGFRVDHQLYEVKYRVDLNSSTVASEFMPVVFKEGTVEALFDSGK